MRIEKYLLLNSSEDLAQEKREKHNESTFLNSQRKALP